MKLDIGCGTKKTEGFIGMDSIAFDGVDIVHDARVIPWPIESNSVTLVVSNQFLEHLTGFERIEFFNELYRVMVKDGMAVISTPAWNNERAYGDPTHQWPPVNTWTYYYLDKEWREREAPHVTYNCDFKATFVVNYDTTSQIDHNEKNAHHAINVITDLIAKLKKQ